jgi:hypothetical protein
VRTRWSDLHVGDRIVFVGTERLYRYTIVEIDRPGRTLHVEYTPKQGRQSPRVTKLHAVTRFLRDGTIIKEEA